MRSFILSALCVASWAATAWGGGIVVDHTSTDLSAIPDEFIAKAKSELHIVYTHTSHGSQIISGMDGLAGYPSFGSKYSWRNDSHGDDTSLSLKDRAFQGPEPDLSQGDNDADQDGIADWAEFTAEFLDQEENRHVNVIMWSWCNIGGHDIERYLRSMEWLISEFGEGGSRTRAAEHPVQFVFMTGHANGDGENDSSDAQNRKIREHCQANNRILFDFADIENYDPDGNYFLNRRLDDALYYDRDGDGSRESNWASEYLERHDGEELDRLTTGEGVAGYDGIASCAHSPEGGETSDARLNCVLKGRAAWHLFAVLAGWEAGENGQEDQTGTDGSEDSTDHSHAGSEHHLRAGTSAACNLLLQKTEGGR